MVHQNVQKEILVKVLQSQGLRYSEARPKGVENDLYNYHLQFLVKKGLIKKQGELYHLTTEGKKSINDTVSLSNPELPYDTFKMSVLCCVIKQEGGQIQILNQKRTRHPFYGDIGIISGKIRKEESVLDAASRKIFEETGLTAKFKNIGLIRKVRYLESKRDFFSDSFWFFCITDSFSGELMPNTKYGENYWCTLPASIQNEKESIQGSKFIIELYQNFEQGNYLDIPTFYHEEFVVVDKV